MKLIALISALSALALVPAQAQRSNDEESPLLSAEEILKQAPESDWVRIDPENLLVIDLPSGPAIVEMRPDYAPKHIERIKTLAREGFYNSTIFHRVIDGFMAQGGDPTGTGTGGSQYPDLEGRFIRPLNELENFVPIGRDDRAPQIGFLGSMLVATQPPGMTQFLDTDTVAAWPLHCPSVLSMARAGPPNSANSQFFIMLGDNRRGLDQQYTAWGKVIDGGFNVRRINIGEPPERPTPILRARVMTDLPRDEQTTFDVLRADSETLKAWLRRRAMLTEKGFFLDACSVNVPIRKGGEIARWALSN
ncbi:MAG: peptidylprolyl isomerase [Parvularculaceae bacterium]|nr:peptidylprolyl isomerase [Parvularculaceae bacterium]